MANRYWVGGTGNWSDTARWSTTSGGTSGATVPGSADVAIFDSASNTGTGAFTATVDTAFTITTLQTSVDGNLTLGTAGNLTCSTSTTINNTTGISTIFSGNASLGAVTLSNGVFDVNGSTLTITTITSTANGSTRVLAFGTNGTITLTGNNATIWNCSTAGTSSTTGTGTVNCTYSGSTGTRTIVNAHDSGNNLVNFKISAGTDTFSFSGTTNIGALDFTGFAGTWTNTALTVSGNLTVSTGMTAGAGTNAVTIAATSDITSNGKTLDFPITVNGSGITAKFIDALTIGSTRTLTLTAGTLDLNNLTLSVGLVNISGSTTRAISFGTTGKIQLTSATASTIWTGTTLTNFSYTGTSNIETTGGGAVTKTIDAGAGTASQALNWNILNTAGTVAFTAANTINNLTLNGTFTLSNIAITLYGNYTYTTVTALTAGTNAWTFGATSGTQTINSGGVSHDFPMTFNGAGGTFRITTNNLTLGSTRTATLTAGTLDLNNLTLSTGIFAPTGSTTRVLAFGTGKISLTGSGTTIWSGATLTSFSYTGTPAVESSYSGATGTRTFNHGATTGGTESNAISLSVTAGTDTLAITGGFKNLVFTGFGGTLSNSARTIYGNLTLVSGITISAGTAATTFAATSGTQEITTANAILDFPIIVNTPGAGIKLLDDLDTNLRTFTLTAGTIDLNGCPLRAGYFSSSNSNTRAINWTASTASVSMGGNGGTVWDVATATNFSLNYFNPAGYGVYFSYSGTTGTRTINHGSTAGGSESNALSISISSGFNPTGDTIAMSGSFGNINLFCGSAGGMTLTNTVRTIYGNCAIDGFTISAGTNATTFAKSSGTQTINILTFGSSVDCPIIFDGAGTKQLTADLTVGSTRATTLTAGTLDLNSLTLSTGLFASSNSNTRAIAFGTGQISLTSTGTIWDMATATGFTLTGTPSVVATTNTATARTMNHGTTAGGTESNAVSMAVSAGTGTVTIAGLIKNLNFTGFGAGSLANSTRTVYGNTIISASMTLTAGTLETTFGATSGTQTINSAGKTFDFPVTFDGAGTRQLVTNNLTVGSTRTVTLTAGTLDLNNLTLSTGLFSSSNSNTRTLAFGTGQITLTSNGATIWNMATATGLTVTGTPLVVANTGGTATTRTFSHGSTAGGSASNSVGFSITAGTDTVTFTATSYIRNLIFTGFSGTWTNTAANIYGNLTVSTGMTVGTGANTVTFAGTSGTQSITSNGKTLDFPVTFDGVGGTFQLADATIAGSTRTVTLTNGTFNANGFNFTAGQFASNNSNTRTITMGSGTWTLSGTGTIWDLSTTTNLTFNKNTANIVLSSTGTAARTFAGGSLTYNDLTIGGTTGVSTLTISGSNTFGTVASTKTVAHTITFTSGETTTLSNWTIKGTNGNLVTINATSLGTAATLSKTGGGKIQTDYVRIQDSAATPADTWFAGGYSSNLGGNTGWYIHDAGKMLQFFFT